MRVANAALPPPPCPATAAASYNAKLRYQHVIPRHNAGSAVLLSRAHKLHKAPGNNIGASQRWRAHHEAVTCLCAVPLPAPHGADAVASSAFDFSVRIWSVPSSPL